MPPLPPPALIAKLYTEAVAQGDVIGPVQQVSVATVRPASGVTIFVSTWLDCVQPDGIPGDHAAHKTHTVVTTERKIDGWSVCWRLWFVLPVTLKAQIADAVAGEERVS